MIPKVLLTIGYVVSGPWGAAIIAKPHSSGTSEIAGAVLLLTAALCFLGLAVLDKLDELKKQTG